MKRIVVIFLLLLIVTGCKQKSLISKQFSCKNNQTFNNLEKVTDFNRNFSIKLPKTWSTQLFYNNNESAIMSADSTKTLKNTFILSISYRQGELNLNKQFTDELVDNLINDDFKKIDFKPITFKEMPAIWFLSDKTENELPFQYFQLFIKKDALNFLEISTKIYGETNKKERLCQSIALLNNLEFYH